MAQYSSVMLIASDGLIQNQGLGIAGNLIIAIDNYLSVDAVASYQAVLANASTAFTANSITQNTYTELQTLAANSFSALTDAIPTDLAGNVLTIYGNTVISFTDVVLAQADRLIGNTGNGPDLGKFAQVYNTCQGYRISTNEMLNASKNSDVLAATFVNMDALTTGGISLVNTDIQKFGADLTKLGNTINFKNLKYLGHPWALLYQMLSVGGLLPAVHDALSLYGVSDAEIAGIKSAGTAIDSNLDLKIYQALKMVTGSNLEQVKILLDVATPGLSSAADLLNPQLMLPNSYLTLITQLPSDTLPGTTAGVSSSTQVNIYNASGAVNSRISDFYRADPEYLDLAKVIPPDQAAANMAWIRSLGQVKNILGITLPALAESTVGLESNKGLGDINALTTPVPDSVKQGLDVLATGTGENGTLTIYDFMGTLAGVPYIDQFGNIVANLANLVDNGNVTTLLNPTTGIYAYMNLALATPVGNIDIPSGPAAGTYSDPDNAMNGPGTPGIGLIPAAYSVIGNIVAVNTQLVANTVVSGNAMIAQITLENTNLALAEVDFGNLQANSKSSIMGICSSLHDIGTEVSVGGPNQLFTAMANLQSQAGQAVIASFREGRNIVALGNAGVGTDTQLSSS